MLTYIVHTKGALPSDGRSLELGDRVPAGGLSEADEAMLQYHAVRVDEPAPEPEQLVAVEAVADVVESPSVVVPMRDKYIEPKLDADKAASTDGDKT